MLKSNGRTFLPVIQNDGVVRANGLRLRAEPPPGSWAETARMMASMFPDSDTDWDAWKDQMKEGF